VNNIAGSIARQISRISRPRNVKASETKLPIIYPLKNAKQISVVNDGRLKSRVFDIQSGEQASIYPVAKASLDLDQVM
jgi:hypothetical protein